MIRIKDIIKGIRLRLTAYDAPIHDVEGALYAENDGKFKGYISGAKREIVTNDQAQILTNKTIDVDNNTVSNIETDNFKINVIDTDGTLAANSDLRLATQKATKTYSDTVSGAVQSNLNTHLIDTTDAHDASAISAVTTGYANSSATEVQAVLDDFDGAISGAAGDAAAVQSNLTNHINDVSGAHAASAISYSNVTSGLTATDTQAAIDEIDGNLDTHIGNLSAHGSLAGTIPLLASQVNTNLIDLSTTKATRILFYIVVDSTFETFDILTVKRGADYKLTTLSVGDSTGITFEITTGGMLTYSSGVLTTASLDYLINTIV